MPPSNAARLCSRPKPDYVLIPMSEFLRKCPKCPAKPSEDPCHPNLPEPIPEHTCPPMNVFMRKTQVIGPLYNVHYVFLILFHLLQKTIKNTWPKSNFKGSIRLGDIHSNVDTFVAQTWPMKFRVRRMMPYCKECQRNLYLRETVTDNQDLLLLSECCNVEVYSKKKLDGLDKVPVGVLTGPQKFRKTILTETLFDPCKKVVPKKPPPPPPPAPPMVQILEIVVSKRKKKKKAKAEPKIVKQNIVTTKKTKTYRVHEYEIHHTAEEVKERKLREAMGRDSF